MGVAAVYILAAIVLVVGVGFLYTQGFELTPRLAQNYKPEYAFCCKLTPEVMWNVLVTPEEYPDVESRTDANLIAEEKCENLDERAILTEGYCTPGL